jgi:D-glycero-alpha-D-manno-heptose-7-phosphate kinase
MPPGQLLPETGAPLRYRVQYSKVDDCGERSQIKHPAVRGALEYLGTDIPLEFHCFGDLPGRSGLGGSSAFTVGLVHALRRLGLGGQSACSGEWEIANDAICIEQEVVKEAVGCQDQVLCAHGGLNYVSFPNSGDRYDRTIQRLVLPSERLEELCYSLVLVFSGTMRDAHEMAARQIAAIPDRTGVLERMREQAIEANRILLGNSGLRRIGSLLNEAWQLKKSITSEVTTPQIDELYERGRALGAIGGKLLGAGGGGFMLFFVPPENRDDFTDRIGAPCESVRISKHGTTAIITEDQ